MKTQCCNADIKHSHGGTIHYCSKCKDQLYPKIALSDDNHPDYEDAYWGGSPKKEER